MYSSVKQKVLRCPKLGLEWKLRWAKIIEAVNASTLDDTGVQTIFAEWMLIISIIWHVDDNSMGQGHDKPDWPFKQHLRTRYVTLKSKHTSPWMCILSENISCKDRSSEIVVLLRWPYGFQRFKSEDSHRGGVRRRSWPKSFLLPGPLLPLLAFT